VSQVKQALDGNRLALSKLITKIENGESESTEILDELFPFTNRGHIIGITGPSGSGKSSLVNQFVRELITRNDPPPHIAVIAVDPTSPFTGGAILGDRIRMRDVFEYPSVFIRSMASRGAFGGIAAATAAVAQVLDAVGFDPIIIETVGAGQSEVEIAGLAYTTIVVEAPGLGDDIQAAKAGILEIADIMVVNKSDKPTALSTAQSLEAMLAIRMELAYGVKKTGNWTIPLIKTNAINAGGITELIQAVESHRRYLIESGEWERKRRKNMETFLDRLIQNQLLDQWQHSHQAQDKQALLQAILDKEITPYQAVRQLI